MSEILMGNDGGVTINLDHVKKITIDHLPDVLCHRVIRSDDITTHELEFINNGKCRLSYTAQGKIIACTFTHLTTEVNLQEGTLLLKPVIEQPVV
ncbi:MAG: hypothetical protein V4501_01885 [Pseudomonadota bacterium]